MLTRTILSLFLVLASANSLALSDKTGDFALIDHRGEFHQLSRYRDHQAVVIMTVAKACDADDQALAAYRKLEKAFAEQPVAFMLMSVDSSDRAGLTHYANNTKLNAPVLMDDTQLVTRTLGLHRSAEVVVLDPHKQAVIFRGPINDALQADNSVKRAKQHYLQDAIQAQLHNNKNADELAGNALASKGCALPLPVSATAQVNFNQDVVPILQQRCVSCHREGGIAPFAMDSHAMIQGWAPMIREVILSKRMPPGQIDPLYNHQFKEVAFLTIEEQQTLVNWIDAGAQNTDNNDKLATLNNNTPMWQLGEPDIIVEVPAQAVPATGIVDYRYEKIPLQLEKDIWVKAVEFLPSAHDVMHHIIAFSLDTPDFSELQLLNQGVGLGAYAPGNQPTIFPEQSGYKLSAGGGLFLQLHYTTSGKERVDNTRIGLYLLDQAPPISMRGGSAAEFNLNIPPNVKESPMTADRTFTKDAYLVSLSPHMHFRGKEIKYTLVYPDGNEEILLSVPNYQFNWQKNYDYIEPKFIPAGSRLVVDGAFDNSAMNPNNPDPSVTVTWGEQSWNEMFFGFYRYFEASDQALTSR